MKTSFTVAQAANIVPAWLEQETHYANSKYAETANPQRSAPHGGLMLGGQAEVELGMYYRRFELYYNDADNDERGLLRASQALGKFASAGRALHKFLVQDQQPCDRELADRRVTDVFTPRIQRIGTNGPVAWASPLFETAEIWETDFAPRITALAEAVAEGSPWRFPLAGKLLLKQAEVFATFTVDTGYIAEPGTDSTGDVRPWSYGAFEKFLLH